MTVVYVFGDIGSGKSAFCAELRQCGASVISSDELVADLYRTDAAMVSEIETALGESIRSEDGSVNKARIAEVIFSDSAQREVVETIIHPRVQTLLADRLAHDASSVIVYEVSALKADTSLQFADVLVEVVASEEVRLRRLIARGMSEADARARIQSQAADVARQRRHDIQIDNSGPLAELENHAVRWYSVWSKARD